MSYTVGPIAPLNVVSQEGTFGDGTFTINFDLDNLYDTSVELFPCHDNENCVPVTWDPPVLDKERFKRLLQYSPETTFQINITKTGKAFQVTVKLTDPQFRHDVDDVMQKLCGYTFSASMLGGWIEWTKKYPERQKFLENIISQAIDKSSKALITRENAKEILTGIKC
jgi:hypothetical protein